MFSKSIFQSPAGFPPSNARASNSRPAAYLFGIAFCAAIAFAAMRAGRLAWLQAHGLSALTLAILLGIVLGNSVYPSLAAGAADGVNFSKQSLLRLGIILYGLRLTFQDVSRVGVAGIVIDALMLGSTFLLAMFIGVRLLKLDRTVAMLIGAGSAICGAAAVMASESVLRAKAEQVTIAVSTIVVFGTLAIFVYPALYATHWPLFGETPRQFGVYAGSTIHEVAQVVAATHSIGDQIADTAVIAKMVRVMMLAPFLLMLSTYVARTVKGADDASQAGSIAIPWFALAFLLLVALNSLVSLPQNIREFLLDADTFILAMAMAALGLTTHVSAVRRAGLKPLMLAGVLFAWLIVGGATINHIVMAGF